ncbi:MAG: porin family protein [Pseudomonadota bacterium]
MVYKLLAAAGLAAVLSAASAQAQEWYVGGSIGIAAQSDSDNSGSSGAFTTGNGAPAIPFGTPIDAGTPYGWSTEFDDGLALSAEFGARIDNGLRAGVELTYTDADVDTHSNVTIGGGSIDDVDAAVLLTGSADQLGASVADIVADGQGDISTTALFANVYYDFNLSGALQPYVGAGIGLADVEVDYSPSGVGIIDDSETKFAYQIKAGATWRATDAWEIYGEYAYRATEDVELDNSLFPGTLDIENQQSVFSIGARYRFGG